MLTWTVTCFFLLKFLWFYHLNMLLNLFNTFINVKSISISGFLLFILLYEIANPHDEITFSVIK